MKRKPSDSANRGVSQIMSEMQTIAEDLSGYRGKDEKQRSRDIFAGLKYIQAAIQAYQQPKEK